MSQAAGQDLPASADLVILGGGVMGLWAAVKAGQLGLDTVLIEAKTPGAGASGGLLGALMPHMPDRWNDKKQFQFDALVALEDEVRALEAQTGLSCGYRRSGRLIPLPKPHLRTIAERHAQEAEIRWDQGDQGDQGGHRFHWHVLDRPDHGGWPSAEFCTAGLVHDTLAARVSPRQLVHALSTAARRSPRVTVVEGTEVARIEPGEARVVTADGRAIAFGHCIVAAGHRSFPLIEALSPEIFGPDAGGSGRRASGHVLGQAVKGQAALLQADVDPALPVIFLNGLYVVAHDPGGPHGAAGQVAIGSTSEDLFDDPFSTDGQLEALVARARALVPQLADAPVIERWAGLRPKAIDRDPMVGPHPDHPRVIALTGGFKVSFGLAHRLADAALDHVRGRPAGLPASFSLGHHLAVASR